MNKPDLIPIMYHIYKIHGFPFENINIFGIRNEDDIKKDVWNDIIGFFTEDECSLFFGTTDPSPYYNNPEKQMNKKGTAHVCLGHHKKIWRVGKHGSTQYTALVNDWRCGKVKVWRDVDKDMIFSKNDIFDYGHFGTNMHRRFKDIKGQYKIQWDSAGCQVFYNKLDFEYILDKIIQSKQKYLSYALFDKKEMPFYGGAIKSLIKGV